MTDHSTLKMHREEVRVSDKEMHESDPGQISYGRGGTPR